MLHTALVVLHAGAGVACFAAGGALHPAAGTRLVALPRLRGSLMAMLGFAAAAIGISWADLELTSRLAFSGLFGLGLYMAWRAYRARATLRQPVSGWRPRYLDDVGLHPDFALQTFLLDYWRRNGQVVILW